MGVKWSSFVLVVLLLGFGCKCLLVSVFKINLQCNFIFFKDFFLKGY